MRRVLRSVGLLLILAGLGSFAWAGAVWAWQDPFTAVVNRLEQRRLDSQLDRKLGEWRQAETILADADARAAKPDAAALARDAKRFRQALAEGDAVARLRVPRLGLNAVVVEGTTSETLKAGPGRYRRSALPGEGQLIYVAGHRTTYGAPFSRIDRLRAGDRIEVELPYATFTYAVTGRRIVDDTEVSVLESRGREELVLQACHPRFFASERYLVYARPVAVQPRGADAPTELAALGG